MGNYYLWNQNRCVQSVAENKDAKREILKQILKLITQDIEEILKIFNSSSHKHLIKLGYVSGYGVWASHNVRKKTTCINIQCS